MKRKKENTRESNFEILRIVSMILIIAHHFSVHGGFDFGTTLSLHRFYVQFLAIGGKIGVNCFMLISGYFLVTSKNIKVQKVIKLWAEVFFYSFLFYVLFTALTPSSFSIYGIIQNAFPITFNKWWFISAYFILYLFSPYINRFLSSLDQSTYKKFLLLMFLLWCIGPTLTNQFFQSNPFLWLFFLYCVAGYIRFYQNEVQLNAKTCFLISISLIFLTFGSVLLFDILGTKWIFFQNHATHFYGMQMITTFFISLFLFLGFKNLKVKNYKMINLVAASTFGVYLIHDNCFVNPFLWHTLFKNATYVNSVYFIPYTVFVIFIVFISCTFLDFLRIYLFEKPLLKKINQKEKQINHFTKMVLKKLKI